MKHVSFVALLTIVYPGLVLGYHYTITDENIRNHSYSVEQISADVYNTARNQNVNAPVFQTVENDETVYYKWIAPDLTQYKTSTNADVFSLTNQGKGSVDFLTVDNNGNVSTQYYYVQNKTQGSKSGDNYTGNAVNNDKPTDSRAEVWNDYGSHMDSVTGNFVNNNYDDGYQVIANGLLWTDSTINVIEGTFVNNGNSGIFNGGNVPATINSITGDFVNNNGVAILMQSGAINSITGDFVNNSSNGSAGAIQNGGTINSISGNFINNKAEYVGAIQNYGTIYLTNNVLFSGNSYTGTITTYAGNAAGAISNSQNATVVMNIDSNSNICFATESDDIYNDGTIIANGTDAENSGHLYLQSVHGNGTFTLNNIYAELASGQTIQQSAFNIGENSTLRINNGVLDINNLQNNGILKLTGGTFAVNNLTGENGQIVIDGDVESPVSMAQNVIINENGSLTISVDNINLDILTNNGLLKLSGGTLSENISNYANTEIAGQVSANADNINTATINNGTLLLTGGTLTKSITGTGGTVIDGNVIAETKITQGTTVNSNKYLTSSANYIITDNLINNGTLNLTDGTLTKSITGTGSTVIDGDVVSNANMAQNTTINSGKSLTVSVDNIKNTKLTNNGTLWFNGGTLDKTISSYGNAGNVGGLNANANLINQAFVNNGTLNLTEGVLNSKITGSGETFITGDVTNMTDYSHVVNIANGGKLTTNADLLTNNAAINNAGILNINNGVLKNDVIGGKTIIGNNAVLESKNIADIDMGGTWNIDSNTVHASNANVNGLINIDITQINADSDKYAGGKLIADNIILDKNSELRLFVSANNLKKGESTGDLSVIEASAWDGNWHNIFQTNNKYDLSYDDIMHTVKITYTKTAADIILEFGGSKNDIAVGTAWDNESVFSDEFIDFAIRKMIERLNYAIQYDIEDYIKMLESIAPNDTHVASGTSRSVNNAINNQVSNRLAHVGRSGGDAFSGVGVWGQGLFNHSSQSGSADFSANTFGLSLGADKKINNTTLFGLGYAFNNTTAVSGARDISSIGHTVFVYGEYRPMLLSKDSGYRASRFHVNGMASYGVASYTEDTYDGVSSEYDTTSIGLNGNIEYDITSAFSLFTGGRYIKVSQDDYFDSLGQKVSVQDEDIITARVGAKYVGDYTLFVPNAHIGISYDVKSSDRLAIVNTANSSYQITGDAISPFGVQAGIGFVMNIDDWDISLNYDLDWHYEFISHTGRIKAKYMF